MGPSGAPLPRGGAGLPPGGSTPTTEKHVHFTVSCVSTSPIFPASDRGECRVFPVTPRGHLASSRVLAARLCAVSIGAPRPGPRGRQEHAPSVDAREPLWARRADLAPGLSPIVEQAREARHGTVSRLVTSSAPCTSAHHPDRARPARRWEALPAPVPPPRVRVNFRREASSEFPALKHPVRWLAAPRALGTVPQAPLPKSCIWQAQANAIFSPGPRSPGSGLRLAQLVLAQWVCPWGRAPGPPRPRPAPHAAAGPRGHGPCAPAGSHREGPGAVAGSAAVGREAAAHGAFSGGRGGLGGRDSVCCVQGVSPVGSGSIGCKLAPQNVLELTEESFPSEQRFTKCVSPESCPVSPALRVRVEERPFGGLTVHRLAGPGLSGPLTRDGVDRPGRAQQGAFPTHARTGGPGADGREGRVFSRMHLSATPSALGV